VLRNEANAGCASCCHRLKLHVVRVGTYLGLPWLQCSSGQGYCARELSYRTAVPGGLVKPTTTIATRPQWMSVQMVATVACRCRPAIPRSETGRTGDEAIR